MSSFVSGFHPGHPVTCHHRHIISLLWPVTVSQSPLAFDDPDRFDEYWSGLLYNVPWFGSPVFFL